MIDRLKLYLPYIVMPVAVLIALPVVIVVSIAKDINLLVKS